MESKITSIKKYKCHDDIKAGDDFYLHVNKSWLDSPENQIPKDYNDWGSFTKLHDTCLRTQIQLVSDLCDKSDKNDEEKKIVAIWNACMKKFQSWRDKTANYIPIVKELEILDAYLAPNSPIVNNEDLMTRFGEYLYYSQVNGISNIFYFDNGSDFMNSNNFILAFSMSGLSLSNRDYYLDEKFIEKRKLFKNHLKVVGDMITDNSTIELGDNFVENVYSFELDLAKLSMTTTQMRSLDKYFTNTTLANLHKKINELNSLAEKQDNFDKKDKNFRLTDDQVNAVSVFMEVVYDQFKFRTILAENLKRTFTDKKIENPPHPEQITALDGDAIRRIFNLILQKENSHRYRSFLQYKIICAYKAFCTEDINNEFFDFYSRKLRGHNEQKLDEKRIIQSFNYFSGEMLGKVYIEKYFPEACKYTIKEYVNEIVIVMDSSIESNDWMSPLTKAKARTKLSKVNVKIGYPDVWTDYSNLNIKEYDSFYDIAKKFVNWSLHKEFLSKLNTPLDKTKWLITPQTVNVYFKSNQNEIVFPAAILQPPFYLKSKDEIDFDTSEELEMMKQLGHDDYDFTDAANLGGIGSVIAHEIIHGYDDQGRKFNGNGDLEDLWTEEDSKLFSVKMKLMEDQASTYTFIDNDDNNKVYRINAKLTTGENLADLGGLCLSLRALNNRIKRKTTCAEELKANQRVFFKSNANISKRNIRKDTKISNMILDHHAPDEFRVNIINNIDEFYDVFNVKETDKMYISLTKRVKMW